MRRCLFWILIFVFAGALVNVAVAWGCAVGQDTYRSTRTVGSNDSGVFDAFGKQFVLGWAFITVTWKDDEQGWVQTEDSSLLPGWCLMARELARPVYFEEAAGWPLLSFRCVVWSPATLEGGLDLGGARAYDFPDVGVEVGPLADGPGNRTIPLIPIWRGFIVNTLFYAAMLWLLLCGPLYLLRYVRRRRGRCPKCGYPMGESTVCSECGQSLPGRAVA